MRVIGIDIGTSSTKGVLVEVADSVIVVRAVSKPYAQDGAPTRDPVLWARLARAAILELLEDGRPDAIGFTGQMHALVALDDGDALAAPVKLWLDMDGARDLAAFVGDASAAMVKATGNIPLPDFTLAKWLHARAADPELPRRTRRLVCAKDYVRRMLDPGADFVVDANEACGMQLSDPFAGAWNLPLIRRAGIPEAALPRLARARAKAGDAGAIHVDLKGVPLVLGTGDQASAARVLGTFQTGLGSLSLGTSGVLSLPTRAAGLPSHWDGAFHLFPSGYDDTFQIMGALPAFGSGLRWLSNVLNRGMQDLDALADTSVPGSGDVVFMPYLAGAGAPHPQHALKGQFAGLTTATGPEALVRSVYDGMASEFRTIVDQARVRGVAVEGIVISGGAARLPALRRTLAAFLGVPCLTVEAPDASAIGAALIAADHLDPGNRASLGARPIAQQAPVAPAHAWLALRQSVLAAEPSFWH